MWRAHIHPTPLSRTTVGGPLDSSLPNEYEVRSVQLIPGDPRPPRVPGESFSSLTSPLRQLATVPPCPLRNVYTARHSLHSPCLAAPPCYTGRHQRNHHHTNEGQLDALLAHTTHKSQKKISLTTCLPSRVSLSRKA